MCIRDVPFYLIRRKYLIGSSLQRDLPRNSLSGEYSGFSTRGKERERGGGYRKRDGSFLLSGRGAQRIGLSSQDSRNPISDKNLILSQRSRGWPGSSDNVGEARRLLVQRAYGGTCVSSGINENDDDGHVLSVPVFGNQTSLRMMDDTLIVRIYAPHVPRDLLIFSSILRPVRKPRLRGILPPTTRRLRKLSLFEARPTEMNRTELVNSTKSVDTEYRVYIMKYPGIDLYVHSRNQLKC